MAGRVLFHVQHLLGIGHVKRAAAIARAMAAADLEVTVALGGPEVPGITFGDARCLRLPAVSAADDSFRRLVDADGREIDEPWKARRRDCLLDAFDSVRPDVLLFELFPFGRRQFRFEIMPLLEAARAAPRPVVVASSVRDVLVRKPKPERNREMVETARAWFDVVLVHGDPDVVPLDATFPEAAAIADLIRYTGYVVDDSGRHEGSAAGAGEVIVSIGGGSVGEPLFRAALAARPRTRLAGAVWRFLAGPNLPEPAFAEMRAGAPTGVIVERARPDFPALLANGAVSISQGGYNTIMDILMARARAVVVPFAAGGESEQDFRARLLAERGLITMLEANRLSPGTLAEAVDRTADRRPSGIEGIDFGGAEKSARLVAGWVR